MYDNVLHVNRVTKKGKHHRLQYEIYLAEKLEISR